MYKGVCDNKHMHTFQRLLQVAPTLYHVSLSLSPGCLDVTLVWPLRGFH